MTAVNRRSFLQAIGALLAAGPAALWTWARPTRAWRWSDYGNWYRCGPITVTQAEISLDELRRIHDRLKGELKPASPAAWVMPFQADARKRLEVPEWGGYKIQLEAPLSDLLVEDPR